MWVRWTIGPYQTVVRFTKLERTLEMGSQGSQSDESVFWKPEKTTKAAGGGGSLGGFFYFIFPKCSSFMPSTSSQMGLRLQEPQSVGMPFRIWDRESVIFRTSAAHFLAPA